MFNGENMKQEDVIEVCTEEWALTKSSINKKRRFLNIGRTSYTYEELAWVHLYSFQSFIFGLIPTGKSWSVIINTTHGKQERIFCGMSGDGEKKAHILLNFLRGKSPSAIFGYTPEIKKAWDMERKRFLESIQQSAHST
jgi:hypothetical protein